MILSFLLSLACVCLPGVLALAFTRFRRTFFHSFPLLCLVQWIGTTILASVLRDQSFGWGKLGVVVGVSTLASLYLVSRVTQSGFRRNYPAKLVWILGLFAVLLVADLWVIQGRQGWSFAEGNLWPHKESYFRGPLNTDAQRSLNVVESLIRGGKSTPFLPDSEYRFQLAWFHWAAVLVAPFHSITRYPYLQGVMLATATLFSFFLLWSLVFLRPKVLFGYGWVVLLLFLHADVFHFIGSIVINHVPGMEADGSFPWLYFRNFSLKLMALVSGHHTMFFSCLAVFLVLPRVVRGKRALFFLEGILFNALVLISAVFSAFFFVFYLPVQAYVQWSRGRDVWFFAARYCIFAFLSFFTHWAVIGFQPSELFLRQMKSYLHWLPLFSRESIIGWLQLPFLSIAVSGMVGLVLLGLVLHAIARRRSSRSLWPYLSVYFLGNFFSYFILSGVEFQRHFSILSAFCGGLLVILWLPKVVFQEKYRWVLRQGVGLSVALHLYFILSFTVKPNVVDTQIPWRDYFELNQVLRQKYRDQPVVATIASLNGGFPVAMEATISFSLPVDVFIHSKITPNQLDTLMRTTAARSVVPYALDLGYRLIIWGPLEEKRWGEKVKQRFITEANLLETVGQARLYRLTDQAKVNFPLVKLVTARDWANYGDAMNATDWEQEAYDAYLTALDKDPKLARCWNNLGELLVRGGLPGPAIEYFQKALELEPDSAVTHFNMGTAYALLNKDGLALREFLLAENLDATFFKAKEMVSRFLIQMGRKDLAQAKAP